MIWRGGISQKGGTLLGVLVLFIEGWDGTQGCLDSHCQKINPYRFEGYEISLYDWVILRFCFHMSIDGRLNEMTLTGSYLVLVSCVSVSRFTVAILTTVSVASSSLLSWVTLDRGCRLVLGSTTLYSLLKAVVPLCRRMQHAFVQVAIDALKSGVWHPPQNGSGLSPLLLG